MAGRKLEQRTLVTQVFDALRQDVLEDEYPPGTELHEGALVETFGVSRGSIREALGRLVAEGLVTMHPRRAATVTALSRKEFLEAYQVREALEVLAIRLAVPRLGPEHLAEFDALTEAMKAAAARQSVERFFEFNSAFHKLFVTLSGNERLQTIHEQVIGTMGRYRRRSLELRGYLRPSVEEHRRIMDAVRRGDADEAARLLSEHIHVPQGRLEEMSDEFSDPPEPEPRRRPAHQSGTDSLEMTA